MEETRGRARAKGGAASASNGGTGNAFTETRQVSVLDHNDNVLRITFIRNWIKEDENCLKLKNRQKSLSMMLTISHPLLSN